MNIKDLQHKQGELLDYQTTFLIIEVDHQKFRIDIVDKREFKLKKNSRGQISLLQDHPLLIDYNERAMTLYINSKPNDAEKLYSQIKTAIESTTQMWRDWTNYVFIKAINFSLDNFMNNLRSGTGILLTAPTSVAAAVKLVCDENNVETKSFLIDIEPETSQLLLIGENYVIAKDFRVKPIE